MGDQSLMDIHNNSGLSKLNPGDLVEFQRGKFSHWAVYKGNKEVVHLTGVSGPGVATRASSFSICGVIFKNAVVCIEDFWEVAKGSKARRNNSKDKKWSHLSPAEIVKKAIKEKGKVAYNLIFYNCEHFAKWCRYNKARSEQVEKVVENIRTTAAITLGVTICAVRWSRFIRCYRCYQQ